MMDNEGYTCIYREGTWYIVNRYGKMVPSEPTLPDHLTARKRADRMNDAVNEKRFK